MVWRKKDMIIYHGSYIKIEKPEIIIQEKGRDFGFGFYTTTIKEQAERWAIRTARLLSRQSGKNENAVINIYDYDENSAKDLNIKSFPTADLEWLELVIKCRSDLKFSHGFDICSCNNSSSYCCLNCNFKQLLRNYIF